jgi:hypothetical protein
MLAHRGPARWRSRIRKTTVASFFSSLQASLGSSHLALRSIRACVAGSGQRTRQFGLRPINQFRGAANLEQRVERACQLPAAGQIEPTQALCFRTVVKRQSVGGQEVVDPGPGAMPFGLEFDLGRRAVDDGVKGLTRGRGIFGSELLNASPDQALRVGLSFVLAELVPDLGNRDVGSGFDRLTGDEHHEHIIRRRHQRSAVRRLRGATGWPSSPPKLPGAG